MCPVVECSGRLGMSKATAPVLRNVSPLGIKIEIGVYGPVFLGSWWFGWMKWPVQPVLARRDGWEDSGSYRARLMALQVQELPRSHSGLLASDPPMVLARVALD